MQDSRFLRFTIMRNTFAIFVFFALSACGGGNNDRPDSDDQSESTNLNSVPIVEAPDFNTPSNLIAAPSSLSINYGEPASFSVSFVDSADNAVLTELVAGPEGLTYDAETETANWTPTPLMLANQEKFYAYFDSPNGERGAIEMTVSNEHKSAVLARSGIPIPRSDFELDIGDFDGDDRTEVLSTDSRELIFTLEFDGASLTQDWLYPFAIKPGESILRLWAYGAELSKILVVTTNGVSVIESRSQLPKRILDSSYDIAAAVFEDFDRDGKKEIVLFNSDGVMTKLNPENGSYRTFGQTINATRSVDGDYTVAVGNVDNDPALEIVVDSGQVVDGASGLIQWAYQDRFGSNIAIGDIDGDGNAEIVASDRWENVSSYDAFSQALITSYNINDFCSLRLYNVDNDMQDELVAGPCQHGPVEIYDGSSGSIQLQDSIDSDYFNALLRSYSFGDLDDDGIAELMLSTGYNSTAADNMAVASFATLGDSTPGAVVNINPSQINHFKSIGWDRTSTEQPRAVFVLPNTDGGDWLGHYGAGGQRLGVLSANGDFSFSDVFAGKGRAASGIVTDLDADGVSEALLGVLNINESELIQLDMDSFAETHAPGELGGPEHFDPQAVISMSTGVDVDGRSKAIMAINKFNLLVYDIASHEVVWTSSDLNGGQITKALVLQTTSGFNIAAATTNELSLWSASGDETYTKKFAASVDCHFLELVVNEAEQEIACGYVDSEEDESTISLFDTDLVMQTQLKLNYTITAMSYRPTGELLVTTKENVASVSGFYFYKAHTLREIDSATGATIWQSAPLLGEINAISYSDPSAADTKMALSTSSAMYIVD